MALPPQYAQHPQHPPQKKASGAKVVLIILAVVGGLFVLVIGASVVMGIYGTRKYIQNAKAAEARANLNAFAVGIKRCAMEERPASETISADTKYIRGLPESSPPVPSSLSAVSARKYMSSVTDWDHPTFKCTRFNITTPQWYQYSWERDSKKSGVLRAKADLDGDGTVDSAFELKITCGDDDSCDPGQIEDRSKS